MWGMNDLIEMFTPLKTNGWNKIPLILIFHKDHPRSVEVFNELKSLIKNIQTITGMRIIQEDGTVIDFRNYNQDSRCVEGINPDLVLFEGKPPEELLNILTFRCHGPEGKMIII